MIAGTPSSSSSRAASVNGSSRAGSASGTAIRSGNAPRTIRYATGNGQVAACPTSPGSRGNFVSSIRMPSANP